MAYFNYIDWHVTPFRAEAWLEVWQPAAERVMSFGAKSWTLTRSIDDPLLFRQCSTWDDKADFERYWYSDEISGIRADAINLYDKLLLPGWHSLVGSE
jgi:hypothetical protein